MADNEDHRPSEEQFLRAAKEIHEIEGDLELAQEGESPGLVSVSEDGGAYVRMWQWVSDEEANQFSS